MKKFLLILVSVLITAALLSPVVFADSRKCVDDHGVPHDCNVIYGNPVYDSSRHHYGKHSQKRHTYRWQRRHDLDAGDIAAGIIIGGVAATIFGEPDDHAKYIPSHRRYDDVENDEEWQDEEVPQRQSSLDLGEWQGAFTCRIRYADDTFVVSVFDTRRGEEVTKKFSSCRDETRDERRRGYHGWMCRGELPLEEGEFCEQ